MMKKVYYLGYYDTDDNKNENRNIFLSAVNKMTYIIKKISSLGFELEVVSASQTKDSRSYGGKVVPLGENCRLRLFRTLPWGNFFRKVISLTYMMYQYRKYLLKTVGPDDVLLVYHSLPYATFLKKVKRKTGCRLVLEVEEIYSDVNGRKRDRKREEQAFAAADAFVFSTQMLSEKVNRGALPFCTIHGTYQVEPEREQKPNDGKIHVVYAGTLDPRKGGAVAAVAAAEFLGPEYHIHILGFGSQESKDKLRAEIERISERSECKVTYDGLLSGEDYIRFIQSCDIGLSTQNPSGVYNDTSFPSKILSYMANGLRVVSIRIPAIETSAIGEHMYYYDMQTPEKIAKAIMSIDKNDGYDGRRIVSGLDEDFSNELNEVLFR